MPQSYFCSLLWVTRVPVVILLLVFVVVFVEMFGNLPGLCDDLADFPLLIHCDKYWDFVFGVHLDELHIEVLSLGEIRVHKLCVRHFVNLGRQPGQPIQGWSGMIRVVGQRAVGDKGGPFLSPFAEIQSRFASVVS